MAAAETRADDLAELAACELLDIGWGASDIATALARSVEWVAATIEKAASEAQACGQMH